jgi:hypothetical protein
MKWSVALTPEQIAFAHERATSMSINAHSRGAIDSVAPKTPEQDERVTYLGMEGEYAVALMLGQPWPQSFDRDTPDLQPDIEVRATERPKGCLILRERDMRDKADRRYVLVIKYDRTFKAMGWIRPRECVSHPFTNPGGLRPARFIKQALLHPMEEWEGAS